MYVYIDESWDLWFDFYDKKPSEFFTISLIIIKDLNSNRWIKKEIEVTLKRKINTKQKNKRIANEIKWSKTEIWIKKYLFNRIKKYNFDIYSITFNKKNVSWELRNNKARLYNYFVRLLVDQIDFSWLRSNLTIILDKSKNKEQIRDCNNYLIRNIEARIPLEVHIDIMHENSERVKQLQLADIFCYGFYTKYSKNDLEWLNIFKEKIKYDELYFNK